MPLILYLVQFTLLRLNGGYFAIEPILNRSRLPPLPPSLPGCELFQHSNALGLKMLEIRELGLRARFEPRRRGLKGAAGAGCHGFG